ncbi:DUF6298 domain-containing protein [Algoriphagus sp. NG3]|uniref:DUF6298 domain-containing protein n=1 Tax=Algoriphagus sp. NG3 TaxID=3097546 RepID=UPI002A7FF003|nr:DUF6298 domain-containing protein [Algoriphagus sp. NG3]WPR77460.1 DUF6298 domain-containing protein [Algoriphagus sp. NG3]
MSKLKFLFLFSFFTCCHVVFGQNVQPKLSFEEGNLVYEPDEFGNRIPDYSFAGYRLSEVPIPFVSPVFFVSPVEGDATVLIQEALNQVAHMPLDKNGFRGAVVLDKGDFQIQGTLFLGNDGVVLRGSGAGEGGTRLIGAGTHRDDLIKVQGKKDIVLGEKSAVKEVFYPLGSEYVLVEQAGKLKVGQHVLITRPATHEWIDAMQMADFGGETGWIGWKPSDHDQVWDRKIHRIQGDTVFIDVPLTMPLDPNYTKAYVEPYEWEGRIANIGIENLQLISTFDAENSKDEEHRWTGISIENTQDAWVRQVNFRHFAGSAVIIHSSGKRVTVEDCISLDPVSEIGGHRRRTFYTQGQQNLFQRCYAENGIHDFSVGLNAVGPNVFLSCESYLPYGESGGIEGWSSGALYDNVKIDGHGLGFKNLGQRQRGAGWTVGSSMLWQCSASLISCFSPPTAQNWAYGTWGQFEGNGDWESTNSHINPKSLFYAQLEARLGKLPFQPDMLPRDSEASTSPSYQQAADLTHAAQEELITLKQWIALAPDRNPIATQGGKEFKPKSKQPTSHSTKSANIRLSNGLLLADSGLLVGKRQEVSWWRGSLRDRDVKSAKPHVTRFVPGRNGAGLTDELNSMAVELKRDGFVTLDHNYGLWYERRRDDHERVRRMDGEVWAPFYEQPFARSGEGTAWDGLSKYDLTKYNSWYWQRLKDFADLGSELGLVLFHQNYFQHNILEAGAHWADSPWRPANNVNQTGFPEPPPYAGDKRIFLAEQFYDVQHPERRKLHQAFIRKGLENFAGNTNVIQFTSAEYTGPLSFMEFWVDEVIQWEKETGSNALLGLSATKDVQDAILEDPERGQHIDVIDIRYWHYTQDGNVYAPEGGKNLAPRQHARQLKPGKETGAEVYRAISEYRQKYPDKAVIYTTPKAPDFGWAVLFGGGSLPPIPNVGEPGFLMGLEKMKPVYTTQKLDVNWTMEEEGKQYLVYAQDQVELDFGSKESIYVLRWIDPGSGETVANSTQTLKGKMNLQKPKDKTLVLWIVKD